ncbi:hypothetical protein [Streptomyces niveus]|uniref:hypothetical protein n=1 Tax=Streptomyces niveus TaxID=193462 RepID=UPI003417F65A
MPAGCHTQPADISHRPPGLIVSREWKGLSSGSSGATASRSPRGDVLDLKPVVRLGAVHQHLPAVGQRPQAHGVVEVLRVVLVPGQFPDHPTPVEQQAVGAPLAVHHGPPAGR